MPDLYAHIEFSKRMMNESPHNFNKELVQVASQGPDPLYFHVFGKGTEEYRFYADRMHDTNTRMLLSNMTRYVKEHNNIDSYSFLFGFLTHYALDVNMHPYVYYHAGVYKESKPETSIYRGLHKKFEAAIDRALMEQDNLNPRKQKFHKTHFTLNTVPEVVKKTMDYTLLHTYGKKDGGTMYQIGVEKMYKNLKYMVKDRFGIKKLIYSTIDLFHQNDLYYKDISLYSYNKNFDYLNNQLRTWHHPITNEPSTKTINQLINDAGIFFQTLIKEVDNYLKGDNIDLDTVFTNLSFNSGIDCNYHDDMKYFKKYM